MPSLVVVLPALIPLLLPAQSRPEAPASAPTSELATALGAMLDLPSPAARRRAAEELATRADVTLPQWIAAAGGVPLRRDAPERLDERTRRHRVLLWVMERELEAEIYVRLPPGPARPGPQPLLFVGHEAGADGRQALATWAPLADRHGLLLAALTEPYAPYRAEGWAYFPDAQQSVCEALRAVRRRYDVDEDRVVIAGVGRGGHMAWDMALRRPDLFSALIPANGSPRLGNAPWENNLRFLEALAPVSVRALQWGEREAVQVANQKRALAVLQRFGSKDAMAITAADASTAFAAAEAGWEALFAVRRRVGATLARVPELGAVPLPPYFGRCHWLDILRVDPKADVRWPPQVRQDQWRKLDEQGRRDYVDDYVRDHSQRLQVKHSAPGRFEVVDRGIQSFRLLLTSAMVEPKGGVVVAWRGHTIRKNPTPSAAVLLVDFAERCDRTFLPSIEVQLP